MENTWEKDYVVAVIMGRDVLGSRTPLSAVWRSKKVAVHLYIDLPLFTSMLTATAACYGKLLAWPISRCDCRASNYLTQL